MKFEKEELIECILQIASGCTEARTIAIFHKLSVQLATQIINKVFPRQKNMLVNKGHKFPSLVQDSIGKMFEPQKNVSFSKLIRFVSFLRAKWEKNTETDLVTEYENYLTTVIHDALVKMIGEQDPAFHRTYEYLKEQAFVLICCPQKIA